MFGGYRNLRRERKKNGLESPLSNRVFVATVSEKALGDTRHLELLPEDRLFDLDHCQGGSGGGAEEEEEVTFEEMLRREKYLELKMKNKV